MSIETFTLVHVVISLIGIGSGLLVVLAMLGANRAELWTALFLAATALTSVTGLFFPNDHLTPGQVLGIISLVSLAAAVFARYVRRLAGPWRWVYSTGAVLALYLNVFVAVVQAFQKLPVLRQAAPTGSELPFIAAQAIVLAIFVTLGILAASRFRPDAKIPAC